ncbi:MAG: hypothetical protein WC480_03435 [Patescibacteria group bacterium]
MFRAENKKGFTVIELVLYIAITASILLVVSNFVFMILNARVKGQVIAEVEQQGIQVMQTITQTIRNSTGVTAPAIGSSAAALTLTMTDITKTPTTFSLSNSGIISITEGALAATAALTNDRVVVSDLIFSNWAISGTNDLVRVQFTVTYLNPANVNQYQYSKIFYATASRR